MIYGPNKALPMDWTTRAKAALHDAPLDDVPITAAFYQTHTQGEWGVGIDAVSALDCWGFYMPGFQGLTLEGRTASRMRK